MSVPLCFILDVGKRQYIVMSFKFWTGKFCLLSEEIVTGLHKGRIPIMDYIL